MHTISKFFTVLIILMVLIPSTIAAPNENANPKAGLKIVDMSKGTMKEIKNDNVKGIKTSSTDIVIDEKNKNSIKLKDSKPSKGAKEHKKVKVSIPASELQEIDVDNDGVFGVLEIADDGTVIGQRTATTAQLVAGDNFTFSEVEINGFSGYREQTFTGVRSGTSLDIVDAFGDFVITMSADGTIPAYSSGVPRTGLVAYYPLMSNLSDTSGNDLNGAMVGNTTAPAYNSTYGANIATDQAISIAYNAKFATWDQSILVKYYNPAAKSAIENDYFTRQVGKFGIRKFTDSLSTVYEMYGNVSPFRRNVDKNYLTNTSQSVVAMAYNGSGDHSLRYSYNLNRYTQATNVTALANTTNAYLFGQVGGQYKDIAVYSKVLNTSEYHQYYAGASGISARPALYHTFSGYNVASGVEKTISDGGVCTAVEYIDTSGATRSVTIRVYYTENTTIATQSSNASFHNISIVHNAGNNVTNGTIIMPIAPLYTGTAVLDSNNTNAVMIQNRTHFTVYTGTLTAADWFGYNVSVPNNADHGMWLDLLMKWVSGVGWYFVGDAPADYTDDLSDQITVTVS